MANSTHINKSVLFKQAYAYAKSYCSGCPEQSYQEIFAWALKQQWEKAKKDAGGKIAEIQSKIHMLQLKSFRYDISKERKALEAQITELRRAA